MKMSYKIAAIVTLLLIPTLMLAYMFVNQSNKEIAFASKELDGDQYLKSVWPLLVEITNHFDADAQSSLAALSDATKLYGEQMNAAPQAQALARVIKANENSGDTVATIVDFITRVGNESNLILDPDLDSYYAMDVIVVKLPTLMSLGYDLDSDSKDLAADYSEKNRRKLAATLGALDETVKETRASLETLYEHQGTYDRKSSLDGLALSLEKSASTYLEIANNSLDYSDGIPKDEIQKQAAARVAFSKATDSLWKNTVTQLDDMLQIRIAGFKAKLWKLSSIAAAFALAALLLAIYLGSSISRAIHKSVVEMQQLASGNLDVSISGSTRRDEIGAVASALMVFKESAQEKARLEVDQKKRDEEAHAMKARDAAMLAERFRDTIGGISLSLTQRAQAMEDAAVVVSGSSEETSVQASAVTLASEETTISVRSVADASDSLNQSIDEISRQIELSAVKAKEAVSAADSTITQIQALTEAANKIGDIVILIQEIADQTNLLALNATIEAARAGDTGKGFAVVASEVKNLANQTAKATTEISSQISDIQSATIQSADAIDAIAQMNRSLDDIVAHISASISEQADATHVIAQGVRSAVDGVVSVSNNIEGVSKAAEQSTQVATEVKKTATALLVEARHLTEEVDGFVKSLTA
ncbi:HAMP domain-containing methyl-accepting chemotaxis protein [uncultured Cohaesibacter sp.]|uniref:methyl-accepting chemotaxis protein n=1 Tax=uncultured Cohaesibacter sp. TaxID=1002546 RepID=UPI002931B7FF|nr:HAMP domain-containing methyl-accepting chemotaxis protein [uncultured Cohaesibacter sp.]